MVAFRWQSSIPANQVDRRSALAIRSVFQRVRLNRASWDDLHDESVIHLIHFSRSSVAEVRLTYMAHGLQVIDGMNHELSLTRIGCLCFLKFCGSI
jgi:hypothetical protein